MDFATHALDVPPLPQSAVARLSKLLAKYAHTPMDYADATLVLLAHDLGITSVATIDTGDFSAYRTEGGKALRIVF